MNNNADLELIPFEQPSTLELTVAGTKKLGSFAKEKTIEGAKWYGQQLKKHSSTVGFATIFAIGAVGLGQYITKELGGSDLLTGFVGYWSAYVGGYGAYLPRMYYKNKEDYPNGFWSKEMWETFRDFYVTDYVTDAMTFAPTMAAVNAYMLPKGYDAATTGLVAATLSTAVWYGAMCAFFDPFSKLTQKVNDKIIEGVKAVHLGFQGVEDFYHEKIIGNNTPRQLR